MGTQLGPAISRRDLRASAAVHRRRGCYALPATSPGAVEQPSVPRPAATPATPAVAEEPIAQGRPRLRLIVS